MRYTVAVPALWIFLVYCGIMRLFAMAILTGHEFFVHGMTFCACQFRMFGLVGLKVFIRHIMASGAYHVISHISGIGDLQRFVNRMAG
jgi:hypothetical protein